MKKLITFFTIFASLFAFLGSGSATAKAAVTFPTQTEIILLEDGDYLETVITDNPAILPGISTFSTTKTVTKTKTTRYKNKDGEILWSVSIKATFSYNGSTSKCTSCSHSTTCPSPNWKIKSIVSAKSGNSATARAVATQSYANILSTDFTKSVTISCSKNGTVS